MLDNSKYIERLLDNNSDTRLSSLDRTGIYPVPPQFKFRPDKAYRDMNRDLKYMKYDMVAQGIDSPWDLGYGSTIVCRDAIQLNRELDEFGSGEFKI